MILLIWIFRQSEDDIGSIKITTSLSENSAVSYDLHIPGKTLRAFRCRFYLRFFSVTLCKYRSNNTFGAKNELSSASRLRARIKLNFNFKSTHSLSKFTKSDDFTTILFQIEISTNFRIRKYQKYFWNDRPVKIYTKL